MLTASFRGTTPPQMQRRGRSRHISPVALARQASEERRQLRTPTLTIPDASRTADPDAPPSPPQSLEDQVQVAYALDNIRLAKILLLRLKGVHVTDDTDPRIDQVRDEDFDVCFVPSGPLTLDDADKRALQESQRKQRQWWHESQRAQRLRACEKLWEEERNRLREDRLRALQRREQDALEQERIRLEKSLQYRTTRPRLETTLSTKRDQDPFQYTFMPPSKPSSSSLPCRSPKAAKMALSRSSGCQHRSVSFKEVINAMNGKLFPHDATERAEDARRIAGLSVASSASQRRKACVRAELLDSLLQVVEWQEGERQKAKGKQVDRDQQTLKPPARALTLVPSVPSSASVASLSSSAPPSRSNSWLSFGSWRSTATDITAPDSPVLASPTSSQSCLLPTLVETQREHHPRCAFVRISVEESPLCPLVMSHHGPTPVEDDRPRATPHSSTADLFSSHGLRGALVKRVTRSVATIVEAAKGLQSAYITATVYTAGPPYRDSVEPSRRHGSMRCQRQLRREGYRALAKDVQKFTDWTTPINHTSEPVHFIPLVSQSSGATGLAKPPVPKNVVIFPSPLRPRTPPAALAYRMRPVANPAVLRLRALQNLMYARGKEWEGRAREGGLGCGKERMLGIAFEGRGRSGLGCEVRFVVA